MLKKLIVILLLLTLLLQPAWAVTANNEVNVAKLFEVNCMGCHPQGGNIIRRGKTLQIKDLKRYKMDSLEGIMEIITQGKNNMSAYGDRLTQTEIKSLATYVLTQAENHWQ